MCTLAFVVHARQDVRSRLCMRARVHVGDGGVVVGGWHCFFNVGLSHGLVVVWLSWTQACPLTGDRRHGVCFCFSFCSLLSHVFVGVSDGG